MKEHGGSCAPHDVAGPLTAPAVVPPNAGPPIAPAILPQALAVPAIYADSPYLSDGSLLARRAQANEVSAAAAFPSIRVIKRSIAGFFLRILDCAMAWRFPVLALECGALKPSDANAMVDIEKTFELWQRQIVTECSVATAPTTFSALLQIARRMTYLTRQHNQDYKKDPELEDIVNWTTGVNEVLDGDEIEVD